MIIIEPKTILEFENYYSLRYKILRKPWNQPLGSEKDKKDDSSIHRMAIDEDTGETLGTGMLQFNSIEEAQIRYMAVLNNFQTRGIGSKILSTLEDVASEKSISRIILQSRSNAINFYKKSGYEVVEKTYLLFGEIQHWLMQKNF